jgi:dTMP kinase
MALFITFEGGDGSGKSTQANELVERLRRQKKWRVISVEEPGGTLLGKMLKEWLRGRDRSLTLIPKEGTQFALLETMNNHSLPDILLHTAAPRAELLAFTIARSQLVEDFIWPNLVNKNIVVCTRYADSTTAYQGYGRGLDLDLVKIANEIATKGLKPDLTILLDLSPEKALSRRRGTKANIDDHFEEQVIDKLDFHQRVREGYLRLAADEPQRWLVVDATQDKEKITEIIWKRIHQIIAKQET